jgi:hypothetical protein
MHRILAHSLLALVSIGGLHAVASAQDLPKRKPGLWEVSMELPNRPGQAMKSQQCVDDKSDAMAHKKAMDDQADSRCENKSVRRDASGTEVNYTCTSARGKTTGTLKLSGDMQSRFTMDNHARFDPPRHGMSEATVKTQGQWMGACPADMKPGEIRMTGMPEGMRARRAERGASGPRSMTPEQMQQMQQMMEQMKKQRGG